MRESLRFGKRRHGTKKTTGAPKDIIEALLPTGWLCYLDTTNGRTQVTERGSRRTVSRAWLLWSKRGAGLEALRAAWRQALQTQGLSQRECPVRGLFEEPAPAAAAAAAPAAPGAAASSSGP